MGCAIQAGRGSFEAIDGEDLGGDVTNNVVAAKHLRTFGRYETPRRRHGFSGAGYLLGAVMIHNLTFAPTTFLNRSSRQL
jgi:hypothetical protein